MIDIKEILSEKDFNDFLDYNSENVHVIKFGASWCGPCKSLEARMKNIDSEKIGNALFADMDINENEECEALASKFGIVNIPCMLYFKNKELVNKSIGLVTLDDIYNRINNSL